MIIWQLSGLRSGLPPKSAAKIFDQPQCFQFSCGYAALCLSAFTIACAPHPVAYQRQ